MKYSPCILVFVFFAAALCLAVAETASAQDKMNLFDPPKKDPARREVPRQVDNRIITGFNIAGDPEKRIAGQPKTIHVVLLIGSIAAAIAGFVYWQLWREKRKATALNDPMILVKELSFAHQLSDREKRLMLEVSNKNSLPSPLQLFVEPTFLLVAWEDETFASSQPLVRRLLSKLFDITFEGGENTGTLAGMNSETRVYL